MAPLRVRSRFVRCRLSGTVSLLLLSLLLSLTACTTNAQPTVTPTATANPSQEAAKIDTTLGDLLVTYQSGGLTAAQTYAHNIGLLDDQNRVRFGLELSDPSAASAITAQITKMGGTVYASDGSELAVAVDLNQLTTYFNNTDQHNFFQELAAFKEVRQLKLLLQPSLTTITADPTDPNEGAKVIGADRWQKAGFGGRGIEIGIIDAGFAGYTSFLGTALPPTVNFKSFLLGDGAGTDNHGVAVAEIVHSIAPQAHLTLAPIEDEIGFTRAVQYFISQKVQVLQISLGWAGIFPGDGTGQMDEALDAARRAGILPVVSAGNYGLAHYLGTFQPDDSGFQRFGSTTTLKLTAEADSAWVSLHWQEPWDNPTTNLDLYILDSAGKPVISSRNVQGEGAKPPTELAPFRTSAGQTYYIQVKLAGGTPAAKLPFHLFAYNAELAETTPTSSIASPGDAHGALTVGATNWKTDQVEGYSSVGPTLDGRDKPEILAPSDITSTVFKGEFAGTSASAPQVSGAAALVWSAAPDFTADQVALYLARNAHDLGPPGRDAETGFGRLQLGSEEVAQHGLIDLLGATATGPAFQDTFSSATSGLPDNTLAHYNSNAASDEYEVQAPGNQLNWNSYLNRSFEEFRAEVTAEPPTGVGNLFYGMIFWQQAPDDYWVWLISDTRYTVMRRQGSNWSNVIGWSQDAALKSGANGVELSLEVTGSYLRLRAGGTILQSVVLRAGTPLTPPLPLGGKFGFVAGQFGGTGTPVVIYKNLTITPLTIK